MSSPIDSAPDGSTTTASFRGQPTAAISISVADDLVEVGAQVGNVRAPSAGSRPSASCATQARMPSARLPARQPIARRRQLVHPDHADRRSAP
jgi:hypothetical protein